MKTTCVSFILPVPGKHWPIIIWGLSKNKLDSEDYKLNSKHAFNTIREIHTITLKVNNSKNKDPGDITVGMKETNMVVLQEIIEQSIV